MIYNVILQHKQDGCLKQKPIRVPSELWKSSRELDTWLEIQIQHLGYSPAQAGSSSQQLRLILQQK